MKKRMRMGWVAMTLLAMGSFVALNAYADTITGNQVIVKVNEVETTYDLDKVKLEVENGTTKVCICRCLCFRALQMLATQFADGVIPRDDIEVFTGWTTDGPEELFVEVMGWSSGDLAPMAGAAAAAYLTIDDAYFFFIQKSTGKAWKVVANEGLYPTGFFTYRTLVKTGQATNEQKTFFQTALRPQAVANMETLPLIDKFDIQAVASYGEDGILHIPAVFVSGGAAYEVELKDTGNYVFELIEVVNAD
jgi:hypothetical protein